MSKRKRNSERPEIHININIANPKLWETEPEISETLRKAILDDFSPQYDTQTPPKHPLDNTNSSRAKSEGQVSELFCSMNYEKSKNQELVEFLRQKTSELQDEARRLQKLDLKYGQQSNDSLRLASQRLVSFSINLVWILDRTLLKSDKL